MIFFVFFLPLPAAVVGAVPIAKPVVVAAAAIDVPDDEFAVVVEVVRPSVVSLLLLPLQSLQDH